MDAQTNDVAAIKFFDVDNTRIYCREVIAEEGNFCIICSVLLFSKKVQKNDSMINGIIKKVQSYEYEIEKGNWRP